MTHYTEDQLTMKKFRNWITFAVVLAMVLTLVVGVSAASSSKPAGIYTRIYGTSSQSSSNINLVSTTSRVEKNPDSAYFYVAGEYVNGVISISKSSSTGGYGQRSYSVSLPIYYSIEATPTYYYVAHCIQGGTSGDDGYYTQTEGTLNLG